MSTIVSDFVFESCGKGQCVQIPVDFARQLLLRETVATIAWVYCPS